MSDLDSVLFSVRQDDLTIFKSKMQVMEEAKERELALQGLINIDQLMKPRSMDGTNMDYNEELPRQTTVETKKEPETEDNKNEVFAKFLSKIK